MAKKVKIKAKECYPVPTRLNFDSGDDDEEKVDYEPSVEEEESENAEYKLPKNEKQTRKPLLLGA